MPIDPATWELGKDPEFAKMMKLIQGLTTVVQSQSSALSSVRTSLEQRQQIDDKKAKPETEPEDLEAMPKKDFMDLIIGKVGELMEGKLTQLSTKLDSTITSVNRKFLTEEVTEFADKHKDFRDWEPELNAISKNHPTLTVKDLYNLARAQNPDKAKELDVKYNPPADDARANARLTLFGGLQPSTKTQTSGGDGKGEKKMTIDEALNAAWDGAVESFPQLAKMGEDAVD